MAEVVYSSLVNRIRDSIVEGRFAPGDKIGTERGFAVEYGISRGSARTAIEQLIESGLLARHAGRGVFVASSPTQAGVVEVVTPNLTAPWAEFVRGVQKAGLQQGTMVRAYNIQANLVADIQLIRNLSRHGAKGAIICSAHQPALTEAFLKLHMRKFPFVVADQRIPGIDISSVVFDDHAAGYLAGQELLRAGHRRIGFIGYQLPDHASSRLEGLRDAVNDAGYPFNRHLTVLASSAELVQHFGACPWSKDARRLLSQPDRPTALVCQNSGIAVEVYRIAKGLGLAIPRDLSVVGFGGQETAEILDPRLSTVDLPAAEMGKQAFEVLINRLKDPAMPGEHRVIPVKWIGRDSVSRVSAVA